MTRETINNEDRGVSLKSVKHILYEVCLHYGNKEIFGKLLERVDELRDWEEYQALEQESKTEKVIKMRDATPEERESIDKYIKSISKPTVVNFWDLEQEPSGDLISRQDAIKAIDEKAKRIKNEDTLNGLAGSVGILFDLPSYNSIKIEPSGDAVSRQAVLKTLDDMDNVLDEDRTIENYKELLKECYEVLPSVKPQEKTGHWEEVSEEYIQVYDLNGIPSCGDERICSECGFETVFIGEHCSQYKFCPYCGAKMVDSDIDGIASDKLTTDDNEPDGVGQFFCP